MARITYLKEIDGALWARLELDVDTKDCPVHVLTEKEIREIKNGERQAVHAEIEAALNRWEE